METLTVIVNPASGGGKQRHTIETCLNRLRDQRDLNVLYTESPGQASELVRQSWAEGRREFMAVGGDGTVFEAINGLFPQAFGSEVKPKLAFLPVGTGNSFLREFSSEGVSYAMRSLLENARRPCDVVELVHDQGTFYFINLLSIGFVAEVGICRNEHYAKWGELGYVLAVLKKSRSLSPFSFRARLNGSEKNEKLLFVSLNNSKYTGGKMMMSPEADVNDGLVNVVTARPLGLWKLLKAFPKIYRGTHVMLDEVNEVKTSRIDFDFEESVNIMVDGEVMNILPKKLEVKAQAIEVFAA